MRLNIPVTRSFRLAFGCSLVALSLTATQAQQGTNPINFTAKSANVTDSGVAIKISVFRWSTDAERNPLDAALNPAARAATQNAAAEGRGGGNRGGGGGGRGGRGGGGGGGARGGDAAAGLDPNDPALADLVAAAGRGGGGRGGRGGNGRGDAPARPPDPIATFTTALGKAPTVGYLWTNETVGYSIKYAYRASLPDGTERIILATDRRLGGGTIGWSPTGSATPTDYEFTLIEIRTDSKGVGEGKTSLTSKVIFDNESKTVALENYAATPAILQNVKR
jgi:hypothetical protein